MTCRPDRPLRHEALRLAGYDPDPSVHHRLTRCLEETSTDSAYDVIECAWNAGLSSRSMVSLLTGADPDPGYKPTP